MPFFKALQETIIGAKSKEKSVLFLQDSDPHQMRTCILRKAHSNQSSFIPKWPSRNSPYSWMTKPELGKFLQRIKEVLWKQEELSKLNRTLFHVYCSLQKNQLVLLHQAQNRSPLFYVLFDKPSSTVSFYVKGQESPRKTLGFEERSNWSERKTKSIEQAIFDDINSYFPRTI
jgi:hypothetical protein